MPIELHVNITSPLTADDHELLSGVSVMLLAVANHELAKERFPEAFGEDEPPEQPAPCAFVSPEGPDVICASVFGHRGRHKFRRIGPPLSSMAN